MPLPRRIVAFLLPIVVALTAPLDADAQQIDSPYRFITTKTGFDIRVGYGSFGSGELGLQPGAGPTIGAFFGVDLTGPWSFEVGGSSHLSERNVIDPTKPEGERVVGTADAMLTEIGARLRFGLTGDRTFHGVNPFVVAGIGIGIDFAGAPAADQLLESGDEFTFGTTAVPTLGTGARFYPRERIEVRGEVGTQLWAFSPPPSFRLADRLGPNIGEKEWVSFVYASFGVAIRF